MPRAKKPTPEEERFVEADKQIREAVGNTNQEQIDRRNAIADRADEYRAPELQDVDGDRVIEPDPEEARAAQEAAAAEEERARLEAEASEAEAKALQEGETPRTFTVRVNGRDVQMTEAELMARAAKVASADEYLQMAQDAVKRTQALVPSQDVSATDEKDVGEVEALLTSAMQGDAEALRKVAQRMIGPSVTPDVLHAVDSRVAFLREVDKFEGSFQDLKKDPRLWRMVVEEDKRLAESEPNLPVQDRLNKAGDTIRTWMRGFSKATPENNPKLLRKASTPPVPSAGGRQSTPRDEEQEEPVENVIDAMAKARGQVQAIRTPQGMFGERKS